MPTPKKDLIIPESMAQYVGFTGELGNQARSRLRNCFSSAAVESKDTSDSGIIECSPAYYKISPTTHAHSSPKSVHEIESLSRITSITLATTYCHSEARALAPHGSGEAKALVLYK